MAVGVAMVVVVVVVVVIVGMSVNHGHMLYYNITGVHGDRHSLAISRLVRPRFA